MKNWWNIQCVPFYFNCELKSPCLHRARLEFTETKPSFWAASLYGGFDVPHKTQFNESQRFARIGRVKAR